MQFCLFNVIMRKYELLLILPGTLDDTEAEKKSNEILELVKSNAKSVNISPIGKNRLAYPVRQIRYGYFYTIVFEAETKGLQILQKKLSLMRDLIRAMVTHFNSDVKVEQKIAYSADTLLIRQDDQETADGEPSQPRPEVKAEKAVEMPAEQIVEEQPVAPAPVKKTVKKAVEKTVEKPVSAEKAEKSEKADKPKTTKKKAAPALTEAEISKKLDDILEGTNIIPGV